MSSGGAGAIARGVQKFFVSNLPWSVSKKELLVYFSKFGHVHSSNVIYDKTTGLSRGYGFIVFSTKEGYSNATSKLYHSLEGRVLHVEPAAS